MVSLGTPKPCLPAVSKTYGKVEITLAPNILLTHTATPRVITHKEIKSSTCCYKMIQTVLFLSYLSLLNSMQKYKKIGTYANSYTF